MNQHNFFGKNGQVFITLSFNSLCFEVERQAIFNRENRFVKMFKQRCPIYNEERKENRLEFENRFEFEICNTYQSRQSSSEIFEIQFLG